MNVREANGDAVRLSLADPVGLPDVAEADVAEADVAKADLVKADRLISDLAALVDAGLVVVEEHVLGPARYGVASGPDHPGECAGGSRRLSRRTSTPHRPAFSTSAILTRS